jgi:hypothetical protein
MARAQRFGRIVKAGMDHLAVARGNAVGDAAGHFGDGDIVAGLRRGARNGKANDARADHQNLHCVVAFVLFGCRASRAPGMTI